MRVLLAEDDPQLAEATRLGLKRQGFAVDVAPRGPDVALAMETTTYDLLLLDLGLPGVSGLEVLRRLRTKGHETPVLILTARDAVTDRVAGLDAGADDYLVKPFDLTELAARARALLRRRAGRAAPVQVVGNLTLDHARRTAIWAAKAVTLSAREWAVLAALAERPGHVLSRAALEERLYGWGEEIESNAIEVYIHGLRRKLAADFIGTVRGVGYRLVGEGVVPPPVESRAATTTPAPATPPELPPLPPLAGE